MGELSRKPANWWYWFLFPALLVRWKILIDSLCLGMAVEFGPDDGIAAVLGAHADYLGTSHKERILHYPE